MSLTSLTPEEEQALIQLLALIYARIDRSKIKTRKQFDDIWNHRVRAAATRLTLGEFVSRLGNFFGLQSLDETAVELVARLTPKEDAVLDLLYRQHLVYAQEGALAGRALRAERRKQQRQLELEVQSE